MVRRVALVRTDVSEELNTSIVPEDSIIHSEYVIFLNVCQEAYYQG
jgi:hypothetical protein